MATRTAPAITVSLATMPPPRRQHGMYYKLFVELRGMAARGEGKLVQFPTQKAGKRAVDVMKRSATAVGCIIRDTLDSDRVSRYIWVELPEQADADPGQAPEPQQPRQHHRSQPMSTSDLKPCPFCGSAAAWAISTEVDDYQVNCGNGDCPVLVMACAATEREAAARWNMRAKL